MASLNRPSANRPPCWNERLNPSSLSTGRSKPARDGHLNTGHVEGNIALGAAVAAQGRDE
jgi:hypothetical protein